jgi:phosphoglycolate phosphatase-like HAD superfamily hydrolase
MELCEVRDALSVAVVGDTTADLLAAQNAKAGWSIGVKTGAHSSADLARCPHSAILESVADLPAWCDGQVLP